MCRGGVGRGRIHDYPAIAYASSDHFMNNLFDHEFETLVVFPVMAKKTGDSLLVGRDTV